MPKYTVYLFGLQGITEIQEVEVELGDGARLKDVIKVLKRKIPALEGPVIRPGEDLLVELFKFNINGQFHFNDMEFQLQGGDYIALLTPATGG